MKRKLLACLLACSGGVAAENSNWQGCYGGVQVGYGEGDNSLTTTFFAGEPFDEFAGKASSDGALFGAQFGCDMVRGSGVYGFQLSAAQTNFSGEEQYINGTGPNNFVSYDTDLMTSLAFRFGYLVNDFSMLYMKIGYVQLENEVEDQDPEFDPPIDFRVQRDTEGPMAALGYEYELSQNFTIFAEYSYVDLGREKDILFRDFSANDINDYRVTIDQDLSTVAVGVNYRF